ncbi:RHS repeat-associated core domain-containing protein [Spongisporangium articulatum]|uniref:RHS repeat-associated core domain-containing protein n=1 Tax=Spongisporangium articulatum TaxID=3362603 RepID=A0ABW8AU79_9ACTN
MTTVYPAIGGLPAETATSTYTNFGTPNTLSAGSTSLVSSTIYTGSGLYDGRTFASGAKRNIDWDMSRRLPSAVQTFYTSGTASVYWQNDNYSRDLLGNVTSIAESTALQSQCFAYDARSRLTQAWTTNPGTNPCSSAPADTATTWNTGPSPYRVKYSYGATQNITAVNTAGINGSTATWTNRPYTYADTAHPAAVTGIVPSTAASTGSDSFTYDAGGRLTTRAVNGTSTSVGYNPLNQLTSTNVTAGVGAGTAFRYAYDADGQRSLKVTASSATAYFGTTEVTATGTGLTTLTGTRYYRLGDATVATRAGSAAPTYLFNDVQGSATLSVTAGAPATATVKRQRYMPYGTARGAANQLPVERGWLGQVEDDATGLIYLNNRYYDPSTGRFLTPDLLSKPTDPSTLNPYTYAASNPVTSSDPTGLCPPDKCGAGIPTSDGRVLGGRVDPDNPNSKRVPTTSGHNFTTPHNDAVTAAKQVIKAQAAAMGIYGDFNDNWENPIMNASKKPCLYGGQSNCNNGYADIIFETNDGVLLVWEVKAAKQGAAKARKEAEHYVSKLRLRGDNAHLGWDIGGPYPYSADGKQIWGAGEGVVLYGKDSQRSRVQGSGGFNASDAIALAIAAGIVGGMSGGVGTGGGGGTGEIPRPVGVPEPGGVPVPVGAVAPPALGIVPWVDPFPAFRLAV